MQSMSHARTLRVAILFAYLAGSLAPAGAAESPAQIIRVGNEHRVQLSTGMQAALTRYDESFTSWRDTDYLPDIRASYAYTDFQAPFAVVGDFNGDRVLDVVLDGKTKRAPVVVVLLSRHGSAIYDAIEVVRDLGTLDPAGESYGIGGGRFHFGRSHFLRSRIDAGPVASEFLERKLVLRHHAFAIEFWEKAATLYVWNDQQFTPFIIAD